jgi:hypothetical protein
MRYFTDMRSLFNALPGVCTSHDWLISDLECVWLKSDEEDDETVTPDGRFVSQPVLITRVELDEVLRLKEIQFCWAVFSALPKGTKPECQKLPYADGNSNLWVGSPKPQLPESTMEIVCWAGGSALLIGITADLAALQNQVSGDDRS